MDSLLTWGTLVAAVSTALATFFLWRVTKLLAVETKRMADAAAQPQVVAVITPNQWSTIHLDIEVANTGNATAFDIEIVFDPPLENGEARRDEMPVPFQRISLLKPAQSLRSYLSDVGDYLEKRFTVIVSWKLHPASSTRETMVYELNMADYAGVSYLGERDPLIQIASQIKKLREDWRYVASGSRKVKTDNYDAADRQREHELIEKRSAREPTSADGEDRS
jgi:hypothetical protein